MVRQEKRPGTACDGPGQAPERLVRMRAEPTSPGDKKCLRCGEVKPLERFDRRSRAKDGRHPWCKVCVKEYRRAWDAANPEKRRAYTRRAKALYPERTRARNVVRLEIEAGRLVRPDVCDRCRTPGRIEAHHHDYGKPLEIEWLCSRCHGLKGKSAPTPTPLIDRIVATLGPAWETAAQIAARLDDASPKRVGSVLRHRAAERGIECRPPAVRNGHYLYRKVTS